MSGREGLAAELPAAKEKGDLPAVLAGGLPLWKLIALGLVGLQIGGNMGMSGGYQVGYSGNASWLSLTIALGISLSVAEAISVFARRFVASGSLLSYISHAFGPWAVAWTAASLLIGYAVVIPASALIIVMFSSSLLLKWGVASAASSAVQCVSALIFTAVAGAFAYRGIDTSITVSTILGAACVPLVLILTVYGAIAHGIDFSDQLTLRGNSVGNIVHGTVLAFGFYVSFDGVSTLAAESRDPLRTVPRMLRWMLGINGVTIVFCCFLQEPIMMANRGALEAGQSPTAVLAGVAHLDGMSTLTDVAVILASIASLIAFVNYGARVFATAAADGFLLHSLSEIHPHYRSPGNAVFALCTIGNVISIVLEFLVHTSPLDIATYLTNAVVMFWVTPYILVCLGAIRVEWRSRDPSVISIGASFLGAASFVGMLVTALLWPSDEVNKILAWISIAVIGPVAVWLYFAAKRSRSVLTSV